MLYIYGNICMHLDLVSGICYIIYIAYKEILVQEVKKQMDTEIEWGRPIQIHGIQNPDNMNTVFAPDYKI